MFKIKHLIQLFALMFIGFSNAQTASVVDCSTVLIVPQNTTLSIDTTQDTTIDSLWSNQSDLKSCLL